MKVVFFCGGLGTRMLEYSRTIPKPMVPIGYRPVLWHLMKYYAHYGHTEFVLCLGSRGDVVKEFFLNYDECVSNDFTLSGGGEIQLHATDIHDWKITFVETGLHANIGQRLSIVREHLEGEDMFLANYADVLSDLPLDGYLDFFTQQDRIAGFTCVKPSHTFHVVDIAGEGAVSSIQPARSRDLWINGGFFALRPEIFDHLGPGSDLIDGAFQDLLWRNQVLAYQHRGFWAAMDTFKEHQQLETMWASGERPWAVWERGDTGAPRPPVAAAITTPPEIDRRSVLTIVPGAGRFSERTG